MKGVLAIFFKFVSYQWICQPDLIILFHRDSITSGLIILPQCRLVEGLEKGASRGALHVITIVLRPPTSTAEKSLRRHLQCSIDDPQNPVGQTTGLIRIVGGHDDGGATGLLQLHQNGADDFRILLID
jgi:hypothetical protein